MGYRTGRRSGEFRTKNADVTVVRGSHFLQARSRWQMLSLAVVAIIFLVLGIVSDRIWLGWQGGQAPSVLVRATPTLILSNSLPGYPSPLATRPISSSVAEQTPTPPGGPIRYQVQPGDTLLGISAKYRISVQSIKDANALSSDLIVAGDYLVIPSGK
jgi:LysM repeat protein